MALASEALDGARTYLNDVGKQIWSDTILLPFLIEAHRDLMLSLWLNGISVVKEKAAAINVAAVTGIFLSLPPDLLEPISLKERTQGSSEEYVSMTEVDFEPETPQTSTLRYWAWRDEGIQFVGATTARSVLLRYWRSLATITSASSALGFIRAQDFLGPQTAAYAAASVGNLTLASELVYQQGVKVGVAGSRLDMIIRANIKGMQNLPVRRIPYRRFQRSRFLL